MKISRVPSVTPQSSPSSTGMESGRFVWETLTPRLIHPLKLAMIEALLWVDRPLSADDLLALFSPLESNRELVRYHARSLAKAGVLETIQVEESAGGPAEPHYFFARAASG